MAALLANIDLTLLNGGCILDLAAVAQLGHCAKVDIHYPPGWTGQNHDDDDVVCVTPTQPEQPTTTITVKATQTSTHTSAQTSTCTEAQASASTTTTNAPSVSKPTTGPEPVSCPTELLTLDIPRLLSLNLVSGDSLTLYLRVLDLINTNLSIPVLTPLLHALLGSPQPQRTSPSKPSFHPECGKCVSHDHPGTTHVRVPDAGECVARCVAAAEKATLGANVNVDLLGVLDIDVCLLVSLGGEVAVDGTLDCAYVVGKKGVVVDTEVCVDCVSYTCA